ncbi:MAG: hypothetical protein IT347_05475 [Candidatus Eisenbacteria bacterium]|nr:hypothetical protein [Candidatus Eisenbacteria bacterium]
MTKGLLVGIVAAIGLLSAGAAGAASIVVPRAGQVGVGLHGDFGTLADAGSLGQEFGSGFGLGVRLRYRMRYERAIGLSFDMHQLDSRRLGFPEGAFLGPRSATDSLLTRDRLMLNLTGFDFYQMFDTRTKSVKWISLGAGLAQVSARLSDGETQYPLAGDGTFLAVGAGVERFVYRSWALDFAARYQTVFFDSSVNHDLQVSVGVLFYAAY